MRTQLAEKDEEITRLKAERTELINAKSEIQRLQKMTERKGEQSRTENQGTRQELESKIEELMRKTQVQEQAYKELEQETSNLRSDKARQEESYTIMEQELHVVTARSEQEAAQYRTLQDSVRRLSSEMAELSERHRKEAEAQMEEERTNAEAREKVLRDRIVEQSSRNDQLEEEVFRLQKALEASNKDKEVLARTNRSLERHLSMQHLKEQENLYRKEELERENAEIRELLSDLDMAAAKALNRANDGEDGENGAQKEGDADRQLQAADMFEQQCRRWTEQAELMSQKLARAEDEARKAMEQNEKLKVALELSQSFRQSLPSRSSTPIAVRRLSPHFST